MIIKRKYEWLGILYKNDELSKEVIDKAFATTKLSSDFISKEELLAYNGANIPAFMNLGCGIPGECYRKFMDDFEKLDGSNPYDNGLTFKDVTKIEYEVSRKGTAIQMRFVSELAEMPYRIVGFAAIQNTNGAISINKGWGMAAPFITG